MSIEGLLRLHGHDTRKVVHQDGTLEFVPADETGAAVTPRQHLIDGLEQLVAEVADKVCAAVFVPPLGKFVAAQCRTEITEFVDTLLTAYSESPHTPAEDRLAAAQKLLAAARDAGDRQAMIAAHDAVERAAAEVAAQ